MRVKIYDKTAPRPGPVFDYDSDAGVTGELRSIGRDHHIDDWYETNEGLVVWVDDRAASDAGVKTALTPQERQQMEDDAMLPDAPDLDPWYDVEPEHHGPYSMTFIEFVNDAANDNPDITAEEAVELAYKHYALDVDSDREYDLALQQAHSVIHAPDTRQQRLPFEASSVRNVSQDPLETAIDAMDLIADIRAEANIRQQDDVYQAANNVMNQLDYLIELLER